MISRRAVLSAMGTTVVAGCTAPFTSTTESDLPSMFSSCDENDKWPVFQGDIRRRGLTNVHLGMSPDNKFIDSEFFPDGRTARVLCTDEHVYMTWEQSRSIFRYHVRTGAIDTISLEHPTTVYPAIYCSYLIVKTNSVRYWIDLEDWTVVEKQSTARSHTGPLCDGDQLFLTGSGGLQAIVADEGIMWKYNHENIITGIASTDERVFLIESNANNGRVTALDANTGDVDWQTNQIGETYADPVVGRDVYVVNAAGRIFALNREDGTVRWTHQTRTIDSRFTVPAVSGNQLVLADEGSGTVRAVGSVDGKKHWETQVYPAKRQDTRTAGLFSPLVSKDVVLVGGGLSGIVALSSTNGVTLWQDTTNIIVSPFAANDDNVFAASPQGLLQLKASS